MQEAQGRCLIIVKFTLVVHLADPPPRQVARGHQGSLPNQDLAVSGSHAADLQLIVHHQETNQLRHRYLSVTCSNNRSTSDSNTSSDHERVLRNAEVCQRVCAYPGCVRVVVAKTANKQTSCEQWPQCGSALAFPYDWVQAPADFNAACSLKHFFPVQTNFKSYRSQLSCPSVLAHPFI